MSAAVSAPVQLVLQSAPQDEVGPHPVPRVRADGERQEASDRGGDGEGSVPEGEVAGDRGTMGIYLNSPGYFREDLPP